MWTKLSSGALCIHSDEDPPSWRGIFPWVPMVSKTQSHLVKITLPLQPRNGTGRSTLGQGWGAKGARCQTQAFPDTAGKGRDSPAPTAANSCFSWNYRVKPQGRGRTLFTAEAARRVACPRSQSSLQQSSPRPQVIQHLVCVLDLAKISKLFLVA